MHHSECKITRLISNAHVRARMTILFYNLKFEQMKKLNVSQMENLMGGGNNQAVLCGIGIGMMLTPMFYLGAAVAAAGCLIGDSSK